MAIFRTLNEFGRESVVLALEPSRECIAKCVYCFAALNSKLQSKGKQKSLVDDGTFENIINRAYSSSYNPEHFLEWSVRNRMVLGYANTVEPFQDVQQARGILSTCDKLSIPLFVQTKGINFNEVWDIYKNFHDNSVLFVSFPTPNDKAIKRFEPGTPKSAERIKMIETAAAAGFHVVLALSPYHETWCDNPAEFIEQAIQWGVGEVFFDRLHLNQRQRKVASDQVMANIADKTEASDWTDEAWAHYRDIYSICIDNDIPIYASGLLPTLYGMYNTLASISPVGVYQRGFQWPYHDGTLFYNLHERFYLDTDDGEPLDPRNRDFNDSIVVEWSELLTLMELDGRRVDQPFSFSSMSDLMIIDQIPGETKNSLKPRAPIQEYYRALWNNPNKYQFVWRHPWFKVALKPDGSPWLDDQGNIMALYDPDWTEIKQTRVCEDIDVFRNFTLDYEFMDDDIDGESLGDDN